MPPQNPQQNPPQGYQPIQQAAAHQQQQAAPATVPTPSHVPDQQLPATASTPYGRDGRLTRAGMEQTIKGGGSVLLDGKHISRIQDIPTSAALARTDAEKDAARKQLLEEQARIQAELDGFGAPAVAQAEADEQVAAELAKAEPVKITPATEPAKTDPAKVAKK